MLYYLKHYEILGKYV